MSELAEKKPKAAVLGAGIMGSGIAQLAAMGGHEVGLRDISAEQLERARSSVERSVARFVSSGRLTDSEAAAVEGRISYETDLAATLKGTAVVIEAVPEVLALKQEVLREVFAHVDEGALICTNTSALSITRIAAGLDEQSSRLVGTHFFNPPVIMRLVELVPGTVTAPEAIERAREFVVGLGREVVVCQKDSPGFITSRAYSALRLECIRMLEEGLASAEDIDKAMRLSYNLPMGPLELGDMNGHDTYLHVLEGLTEAFGERFRPTVGLRNMVAANRLGRKTGAGFYEYPPSEDESGETK